MWWNPTHDHNVNCFSMRSKLGMLSMSMNGGHSLLELKPLTEGTAAQDGVDSHTHTHTNRSNRLRKVVRFCREQPPKSFTSVLTDHSLEVFGTVALAQGGGERRVLVGKMPWAPPHGSTPPPAPPQSSPVCACGSICESRSVSDVEPCKTVRARVVFFNLSFQTLALTEFDRIWEPE